MVGGYRAGEDLAPGTARPPQTFDEMERTSLRAASARARLSSAEGVALIVDVASPAARDAAAAWVGQIRNVQATAAVARNPRGESGNRTFAENADEAFGNMLNFAQMPARCPGTRPRRAACTC